jgi:hypothetical protein
MLMTETVLGKSPEGTVSSAQLPHTATGKLQKMTLRETFKDYRFDTRRTSLRWSSSTLKCFDRFAAMAHLNGSFRRGRQAALGLQSLPFAAFIAEQSNQLTLRR